MFTFARRYNSYLLILIGTLVWSLTMVKSGLVYDFGLGFWGPNGHDGIWHLSIIGSLAKGSLGMPIFSGSLIQNYHLGYDLLLALIHRLTTIPISILYFQIIPPIMSLLVGIFVYRFIFNWQKSSAAAWWSTFLVYFGGSLGWMLGKGESVFWANQSISSLLNPPYVLSLIILLLGLMALQKPRYLLAIICFTLLPQIKVYAGFLAFAGLFAASFKNRSLWKIFIPSAILAALIFLPLNIHSSGLLVFHPGWFLLNLFNPDHLDWPHYFSAINTYTSGGIWLKGLPAYLLAFLIFLIGNLGTRIIFILGFPKKLDWLYIFIISLLPIGIIIPMLFLQSGTSWNTIQFFYYVQFFTALLAGPAVAKLLEYRLKKIIVLLIILLTLPTTFLSLKHFLPNRPPAKISLNELSALSFLAHQPPGVVLTYPFDKAAADMAIDHPPRPLYLYESTAYVSAFSRHTTFLEDQVNLDITGFAWKYRRDQSIDFFTSPSLKFLTTNQIRYLYLTKLLTRDFSISNLPIHQIFTNSEIDIYEVN